MMCMIYGRAGAVKFFDAPEPRRAVQGASARFPRVWIRNQTEAPRRRISGLARWG
nr:MAG TPA: hypothetical protein [Caudoviricetes sp.]